MVLVLLKPLCEHLFWSLCNRSNIIFPVFLPCWTFKSYFQFFKLERTLWWTSGMNICPHFRLFSPNTVPKGEPPSQVTWTFLRLSKPFLFHIDIFILIWFHIHVEKLIYCLMPDCLEEMSKPASPWPAYNIENMSHSQREPLWAHQQVTCTGRATLGSPQPISLSSKGSHSFTSLLSEDFLRDRIWTCGLSLK